MIGEGFQSGFNRPCAEENAKAGFKLLAYSLKENRRFKLRDIYYRHIVQVKFEGLQCFQESQLRFIRKEIESAVGYHKEYIFAILAIAGDFGRWFRQIGRASCRERLRSAVRGVSRA